MRRSRTSPTPWRKNSEEKTHTHTHKKKTPRCFAHAHIPNFTKAVAALWVGFYDNNVVSSISDGYRGGIRSNDGDFLKKRIYDPEKWSSSFPIKETLYGELGREVGWLRHQHCAGRHASKYAKFT